MEKETRARFDKVVELISNGMSKTEACKKAKIGLAQWYRANREINGPIRPARRKPKHTVIPIMPSFGGSGSGQVTISGSADQLANFFRQLNGGNQ